MKKINLGKNIARLRKKNNLTQLRLAEKLSVSDKTVSKWESGGGCPEITQLPAIAEVFGVSIDSLFKDEPQGIAIAGNILVDIVNIIEAYPSKSMLVNILSSERAVGGCVPNTIIDLACIDPALALSAIGRIGNDENGRYVLSEMQKHGIDISKVITDSSAPTSADNVMSERTSGDRTFFYSGGASKNFSVEDVDVEALDCKMLHVGYVLLLDELDRHDPEYGTKLARLLHKAREAGIKTSFDVVSEESDRFKEKIIPALRECDSAIMNEIECCKVSGLSPRDKDGRINIENIKKTMESFIEIGVREKVVVHCSEAGFMLERSGKFTVVPSLVLPKNFIKGATGAGDSFAAACLYGIYNEWDAEKILEFASKAAACNLTAADSVSGMRTAREIDKMFESFERRKLERI